MKFRRSFFSKVDLCCCLLVSEYQSDLCNVVGFISEPRGFIVHCILDFHSKYLRVRFPNAEYVSNCVSKFHFRIQRFSNLLRDPVDLCRFFWMCAIQDCPPYLWHCILESVIFWCASSPTFQSRGIDG